MVKTNCPPSRLNAAANQFFRHPVTYYFKTPGFTEKQLTSVPADFHQTAFFDCVPKDMRQSPDMQSHSY
jgi:hypothetical protein